ncbi:Helicase PriA essential for oriC/DnaA-independent DNA replication [Lunatimonas lonarensis]|uniref:Replication restart protein PriA n=2 Tax=Lunatimonas lonarensis TaxID=1232681 RepID=R7ZWD3_9BACT|nr:Helicase PriA essential for oriC/DnaA-independent DNA replication [Lunatimonas lonarensis]
MFTYRIPTDLVKSLGIGFRVIVPFGSKKIVTGIVGKVHQKPPTAYDAKQILDQLDNEAVVNALQIKFWDWMASYYCCNLGEVMNAALPSGLKISSESKIQLHPHFSLEDPGLVLDKRELVILEALADKDELDMQQCADLLGVKSVHPIIKSLVAKEAVLLFEQMKEKYSPKKEVRIRMCARFAKDKKELEGLFLELKSKPKQEQVLLKYLQEVPIYQRPETNGPGMQKAGIKEAGLSQSSLHTLIKNGVFEEFQVIISRFEEISSSDKEPVLTTTQQEATREIKHHFADKQTVLLHGITGSGKTEIYVSLIQEALASGSQVLLLLPEIALTTHMVSRLLGVFGSKMGVFHSKYSDNERVEVWQGVLSGKYDFVVGVRSSLFLPFSSLGLIIVDEEHENSYKQYDPAPRFQARDSAIMLAWLHQAKVLLGSATPSFESYQNAILGKYGLVQVQERYGNAELPHYLLANINEDRRKNLLKLDMTRLLRERIQEALNRQEQVLLFQNRRGYSPFLSCEECGWTPSCERCDVSLTYHQYSEEVRCHYCGFKDQPPKVCGACGHSKISAVGLGTERIEETIGLLFPEARVARMDLDTTRSKYGYQRILEEFAARNIDILVGTQMISKGLDFDGVTVVGVMDADRMLYYPDFRSGERAFQMITQVAGRAGRRDKPGTVILQTRKPDHSIFEYILKGDYVGFFRTEMQERRRFFYPPWVKNIRITVKHKDRGTAEQAARLLVELLKDIPVKKIVLGPEKGLIGRIKDLHILEILVKLERSSQKQAVFKQALLEKVLEVGFEKPFRSVRMIIDVDPA